MDSLTAHNLKKARANQIRLTLQELFEQPSRVAGEAFLKRWYFWATYSRLEPIIEAAKTIKRHWEGVHYWFDSLIQVANARARGYRTNRNLITMAYLIVSKLKYNLLT
jgi:transposase